MSRSYGYEETAESWAHQVWRLAIQQLSQQFRAWQGQAITVTGPQFWVSGRAKTSTQTGWIDYVTPLGFGLGWTVQGAWGQDAPSVLRVFIPWTDLWASTNRTQLRGTMMTATASGSDPVDISTWLSEWVGATTRQMPLKPVSPKKKTRQTEPEASAQAEDARSLVAAGRAAAR